MLRVDNSGLSNTGMRRRGGGDGSSSSRRSFVPDSVKSTFRKLDVYPKLQEDFRVQTRSGAAVSITAGVLIFLLFCSELSSYMTTTVKDHVVVDPTIGIKMRINFNITFHALTCAEANIDAMDVAGDQQNGIDHDIFKTRLSAKGDIIGDAFRHDLDGDEDPDPLPEDYCGSCYGASEIEGDCCNTCDKVKKLYVQRGWNSMSVAKTAEQCIREAKHPHILSEKGEGCRVAGYMLVNKVAGNIHVALGEAAARNGAHIHQFNPATMSSYNASHTIHSLSFGEYYPGQHNPLDGQRSIIEKDYGAFQYFIKIIPTIYRDKGGVEMLTNQYSFTHQYQPGVIDGHRASVLPGVFIVFDLSPFMVRVTEHTVPFTHFLTGLCAIAGGVVTVAGFIDSALYHAGKYVKKPLL